MNRKEGGCAAQNAPIHDECHSFILRRTGNSNFIHFFFSHFLQFVMPSTQHYFHVWFMFRLATIWRHSYSATILCKLCAALVGPINLISTYQNFINYYIFGAISFVHRMRSALLWEKHHEKKVCFPSTTSFHDKCWVAVPLCLPQVIFNNNCCNQYEKQVLMRRHLHVTTTETKLNYVIAPICGSQFTPKIKMRTTHTHTWVNGGHSSN